MAPSKTKARVALRAGTELTYNAQLEDGEEYSKTIEDIEYIKPRDDGVYLAVSLMTGYTALGETDEDAYSSLIFKLYNYLREIVLIPEEVNLGEEAPLGLRQEANAGLRMPQDRQQRALEKGIEQFRKFHANDSKSFKSQIVVKKTTKTLDDTDILEAIFSDTYCAKT